MANKAFAELTALPAGDLVKKAAELRVEIANLARGTRMGEVQNVRALGTKKRELARVLTAAGQVSTKKEEK